MMKTLRVKPGRTAAHAGAYHGAGWTEQMSDDEAAAALSTGDWEEIATAAGGAPRRPEGEALTEAIIDVIGLLGPGDFGQSGAPNVKPLEALLGFDITAEDRDTAWARLQAATE